MKLGKPVKDKIDRYIDTFSSKQSDDLCNRVRYAQWFGVSQVLWDKIDDEMEILVKIF